MTYLVTYKPDYMKDMPDEILWGGYDNREDAESAVKALEATQVTATIEEVL